MYGFGLETVCRTSKQLFENNNNNNNNNNNSNNNSNNKCNPLHVNAQHKSNYSITAKKKKKKTQNLEHVYIFVIFIND